MMSFLFKSLRPHWTKVLYTAVVLCLFADTPFAQPPAHVPTSGLVGWWPFNGNAMDESGNGNHGSISGASTGYDRFGQSQNAYFFDNLDFIEIPDQNNLRLHNTDFTISFWAKVSSYQNPGITAFFRKSCPGSQNGWGIFTQNSFSNALTYITSQGNDPRAYSNQLLGLEQWVNVTITYNFTSGSVAYFLNGSLVQISFGVDGLGNLLMGMPSPSGSCNAPLRIGHDGLNNNNRFNGWLDDIGIWNRTLTPEEIADLYNPCTADMSEITLACKQVNLSLGNSCQADVTPSSFLTGWDVEALENQVITCLYGYDVTIFDVNGDPVDPSNLRDYLGQRLDYSVVNEEASFSCSNTVLIEDKMPPVAHCQTIDTICVANMTPVVTAYATDNCGANIQLANERHELLNCNPENYISRIVRKYIALDEYGNKSDTCTSVIYLERSTFGGVIRPNDITINMALDYDTDDGPFGFPDPSVTGVPAYLGNPVYPGNLFNSIFCNAAIRYEDVPVIQSPCRISFLRQWYIMEWWCNGLVTHALGMPQQINILDINGPVMSQPGNINKTTSSMSCNTSVTLPAIQVYDVENTVKSVFINISEGATPVAHIPGNGGTITLSQGIYTATYTAIDHCNNISTRQLTITIQDLTQPVPVCDDFVTVSLNGNGYAELLAVAVDAGSFDACGEVIVDLQRMEDPCGNGFSSGYHSKVIFCCDDANQERMVTLRVRDEGGNTNYCMVSVMVQDKFTPVITCPDDITIRDCSFTFDPANLDLYFGTASYYDNCDNNYITQEYADLRNMCGTGLLTRTFYVYNGEIAFDSCTQTITFVNGDPFDGNDPADLNWPDHYTDTNNCDIDFLDPEDLPLASRYPIIAEDACDRVGFTYEDEVFSFATNQACFKIIRHWKVLDWCQQNEGGYLTWSYDQEIKVVDQNPPVITSPITLREAFTVDAECDNGYIELLAFAIDCTPSPELRWRYTVREADGTIYETGTGNDASGEYDLGSYTIEFVVEDNCGNQSITGYPFRVVNVKPATAICMRGMSTQLVPTDTNGDGTADTERVTIPASTFDNNSYHSCYPDMELTFSYSSNTANTQMTFDCDDLGQQDIQMWVTDENGNQVYCETFILVIDTNNVSICPENRLALRGIVAGENGQQLSGASVKLEGSELPAQMTREDGAFAFEGIPAGSKVNVIPFKDGDDANGISTLDIVLIQRHVLGIEKLNSPYKMIAADINKDNRINAVDLIELRKLILGISPSFVHNDSWRFIEKNHSFPDMENPWAGPFPEICPISALTKDMYADFVAVKTGDVNLSAQYLLSSPQPTDTRSSAGFILSNVAIEPGQQIDIPVKASFTGKLLGWQQNLLLSGVRFTGIKPGIIAVTGDRLYYNSSGILTLSADYPKGVEVAEGDILFYISLISEKFGALKDMISEGDNFDSEIYINGTQSVRPLTILWNEDGGRSMLSLIGQAPNPWKDNTTIRFMQPESGYTKIKIKDASGRSVMSDITSYEAGENTFTVTRAEVPVAGVYVIEFRFDNQVVTNKFVVID